MKIKKLFKIFSFIFVVLSGIIFGTTSVSATATRGDIIGGKYVDGPYYVMHSKGTRNMWFQGQFLIRNSDGQFVYCIQPFVKVKEDNTYSVTTEDIASVLNITPDTWNKISRIAYYGYGYKDNNYDHTSEKWYIATQMIIWNLADPSVDTYFTNTLKGTRNDNILASEMKEIEDIANNHLVKPNIGEVPKTMTIGQTITLTDYNNVLNNYSINNVKNGIVEKNGNNLIIKATGVGNLSFTIDKFGNRYGNPVQLYYAVDSQNAIRRGDIDPIRLTNNITVYGGKVTINKTDNDTIENKPQGEATLKGAVYGIYKEDGTKITTVTTKEDGKIQSDYLPSLGRYYLLEEKASNGYQLDKNKYYFDITENQLNPEVQVFEKVINRDFDFTKVYADNNTGIMTPEIGVKFGIYNNKNELVLTTTTDKQGSFKFNLPYGTYMVKQLTTTKGYEKAKDFTIEVKTIGETVKKVIANAEVTAKLKVIKVDKETGKVIERAGIKFQIVNAKTGELVKQKVTYPTVKVLDTFETDENGILITPYPLGTGTYYLKEIDQVIDGYLWNTESKKFTIDENSKLIEDEIAGILFETKFENTPVKGKVEITKLGEVASLEKSNGYIFTNEVLSGIEFGLFQNNNLIFKGITNEKGILTFDNLKLGSYCIKELKTKDGYILNDIPVCFELKYKDQYTPIITYKAVIKNKLNTSKFEFTKTDYSTDKPLSNTKIKIYTINDELVYEGRTDENGKIILDRLPIGKYYIEESEAPRGYLINEEKMYFEVKGEDIVKANMKDEKITGTLEFTKVDISTSAPLPNTLIEIYNENDELVYEGRTDENGKIIIEKLEYGKYYILEKEAPEGYMINTEKMYFEILEDGEIVKATMTDDKVIIDVPNTEENEFIIPICIIIIGLSMGVIICEKVAKKKNQKNKKSAKNQLIIIGSLIIMTFCLTIIAFRIYCNYMNDKINENLVVDFFEEQEEIIIKDEVIEETKKETKKQITNNEKYIGVLEINKINMIRGFYSKKSKLNNVNKNIKLLEESNMPDEVNGNVIIAGHSGNSYVSFFKNLLKLEINDEATIYYEGKTYKYLLMNQYEIEKTGTAYIKRNANKSTLTLITCRHNTNKQLVYIFELMEVE